MADSMAQDFYFEEKMKQNLFISITKISVHFEQKTMKLSFHSQLKGKVCLKSWNFIWNENVIF